MTQAWACGGGTQSAAIAALIVGGDIAPPDLAYIVDTEREKSTTWAYYDSILRPELARVGVDLVRIPRSQYCCVDVWADNGTILIPVYTSTGKLSAYCSNEWKKRVGMRWLRDQGVKSCENWLGISTDEMKRVRFSGVGWLVNKFPLIELGLSRSDCIATVLSLGWPKPPRSSCWMCPNMGTPEWVDMQVNQPNDYQKAVTFEGAIRKHDPEIYLRKERKPLAEIEDFEESTPDVSGCDSGYCFV